MIKLTVLDRAIYYSGMCIVTFWSLGLLNGCGPSKAELEAHERAKREHANVYDRPAEPVEEHNDYHTEDDIEIRVIDSCEYIIWHHRYSEMGNIVHKQNCRNPFHQNKN